MSQFPTIRKWFSEEMFFFKHLWPMQPGPFFAFLIGKTNFISVNSYTEALQIHSSRPIYLQYGCFALINCSYQTNIVTFMVYKTFIFRTLFYQICLA